MTINQRIQHLFSKVGLTPSEIKLYMIVYKNPGITLENIQDIYHYSLASIYRAIEFLSSMNLLTTVKLKNKKHLYTTSLRNLAKYLSKEQRNLRKIERELYQLDTLMQISQAAFTEDPLEMITEESLLKEHVYRILAKSWEDLLVYGSAERLIDILGEEVEKDFVDKRYKQGRKCYGMWTEKGEYTQSLVPNNEKELRDMKIIVDKENQDHMTYIYDDEVSIFHKDNDCGNRVIITKDPLLVRNYKNMFHTLWKSS